LANAEYQALVAASFGCPEREAGLVAEMMVLRNYPHRSTIALRGDVSNHLYLVIDGLASADLFSVDGQYAQLAGYGPGELFGAYPEPTTHRADITAQGGLNALLIETQIMTALSCEHAAIAQGIAHIMARQLDLTLDRMAARIGLSATGRCYRALLQRCDDDGWIKPAPVLAALAIGVNTTRETASRALANLVRRGIVERENEGLRIVSRRMLEDMVI
jgi:CRP/FNR family transcriptional regulator, cyclic AMP receptor protein